MNTEERRRILNMIASGKISAEEGEALLDALPAGGAGGPTGSTPSAGPRFLRVLVEGGEGQAGGKVNVRVPMPLIRAGVRLAALLPTGAHEQINRALREKGIDIDVSKVKPENLEELVQHLSDLTVDVEGDKGEKVRVFCE